MDSRGWSDIAYQIAVDQSGRAWTLRGLRTQSGANGNADLNERYGAILLVLVTGEQPTSAMKATVRAVIADFRKSFPRGTAIRPHSAVRPDGTDCPGPAARAALARGEFTPTGSSEDDMTPAQMQELKNFIEARTKAYAIWVQKQIAPTVETIVKRYALHITEYERQTDDADAARAAAAVWATQPKAGDQPTGDPTTDPSTDPTTPPTDESNPVDPVEDNDPVDPNDQPEQALPPFPPLPDQDQPVAEEEVLAGEPKPSS